MRTAKTSPSSGSATTTPTRTEPAFADRTFLGASTFLFLASAGATLWWCGSMSGGMPMPGGWTMSMAWMRMPGQSWLRAAITFMAMWVLMMVAMMLPSLVPMLASYRRAIRDADEAPLGTLTALAGAGYFAVWTAFGAAAYPLGLGVAAATMRWPSVARSVPLVTGALLVLAGLVQLSGWKAGQLTHCRNAPGCERMPLPDARSAWRYGLRLGAHCSLCCSGLMAVLLVIGVMDVGAMTVVAAAITAERHAARPERVARAVGGVVVISGVLAMGRALAGA
jgi:predicted metal-binding membrane protein